MNSTCHVLPSEDLALLWAYMLSPASIAQCTCSDVHKLRFTAVSSSENVFYLNKFPCRRALIVGTVVGVTLGEGRVVYLVDDGTEVLECICWSKAVPQEVDKQKGWTEGSVFRVGHVVQVMGKVESYRDDRQLNVESLGMSLYALCCVCSCQYSITNRSQRGIVTPATMRSTSTHKVQQGILHLLFNASSAATLITIEPNIRILIHLVTTALAILLQLLLIQHDNQRNVLLHSIYFFRSTETYRSFQNSRLGLDKRTLHSLPLSLLSSTLNRMLYGYYNPLKQRSEVTQSSNHPSCQSENCAHVTFQLEKSTTQYR